MTDDTSSALALAESTVATSWEFNDKARRYVGLVDRRVFRRRSVPRQWQYCQIGVREVRSTERCEHVRQRF